MLVPLLIFASVGCLGLLAALRPEVYVRYFLAEFQRRALSGNLKAVSFVGWVIFCGCMAVVIALPFQSKWSLLAPVFSPLFFLVCAVAYIWWSRTPAQPRIIPQANNGAMGTAYQRGLSNGSGHCCCLVRWASYMASR